MLVLICLLVLVLASATTIITTTTHHDQPYPSIDVSSRYDIRDEDDRSAPSFSVGMR